jgi:outer membrane immunogenic protein
VDIMTKYTKLLLGAVSFVALASAARAADAVIEEVPVAGYNWSGFYIGAGVGAGANVSELSSLLLPGASLDGIGGEGVFGELTIGYDYMFSPRFLVGALADVHYSNIETSLEIPIVPLDVSVSDTWGFDVGLRAGYLFTPTTLGYVLGGYAWQQAETDGLDGLIPGLGDFDWDRDGYFVGVGVETVITGNWTLKTEYRFTQFGDTNILDDLGAPDGFLDTETSRHTFHVGANYRFGMQNGGGASFEVPAYNWTGFYVGGALGAGAAVYDLSSNIIPGGIEFNGLGGEGIFGELNAGYDYDFGMFVAGVQVDGRYSGISTELDTGLIGAGSVSLDADYGFDLLARAGVKLNESTLAYALAGYSWQHFDLDLSDFGADDIDWDSSGFSVGGGLEAAVTENVSVNLEYRYSQFDSEDFSSEFGAPDGALEAEPSFHTVRIGAKYKFN